MAFGFGFGGCGCSTWCTHRKLHDDPEIQWSKNATGSDCDTGATVYDSAIDGSGNVYVVGGWNSTFDVYGFAKAYDASGTVLWTKYYPRAMHCCSTDSTYLWIGGESRNYDITNHIHENAYKLDVSDGSTVWSVLTNHETLLDCVPDGAGGVYFCGTLTGPGFFTPCGYCSHFNSNGGVTDVFGGGHFGPSLTDASVAYSIDLSDGNIYIGSTRWRAFDPNCSTLDCGPLGTVAKFNSDHELVFLFGEHLCAAVKVAGESLYCGFSDDALCQLQKWLIEDVTREWGRTLQVDKPLDAPPSIGLPLHPSKVTDIDVSQSGVYVTHQWWVSKFDHDGNYLWSNRHAVENQGDEEQGKTYFTVEVAPEDSYAYEPEDAEVFVVGGRPALCEVEDQDDSTTPATCDCEPEPVCLQTPNTIGPFGGIYSWICPGEEIPCSVPDTFYGSGCFDEIEVNHTWTWNSTGKWTTQFAIPCGESAIQVYMEATQVSGTECTGWEVTALLTGVANCEASGAVTVTACWCSETSPYDHPWFQWEKTFDLAGCDCCGGDGGGGNDPPGGVTVDCCENPIPETLTATFTGALSGTATLTYDSGAAQWIGILSCGALLDVKVWCESDAWSYTIRKNSAEPDANAINCEASGFGTVTEVSCDPLVLTFSSSTASGCPCGVGSWSATVEE